MIKKSDNPLIFFDDDPDGLCSYLQIKKYFQKGNGCVVKSSAELTESYAKKVDEYSPDLVIVLDKPILSQGFVDRINVPIIWIDHHPVVDIKGVHYFNPLLEGKDPHPVSYWCYKLTKKFLWIGTIGAVSDYSMITVEKFNKKFPELEIKNGNPAKAIFTTEFGRLVKLFNWILKDPHYKVMQYVNILEKIESPKELLENTSEYSNEILQIYERVEKKYQILLKKAMDEVKSNGKVIAFTYNDDKISFTAELSNELMFKYPDEIIIVGRVRNGRVKMSIRSTNFPIDGMVAKALEGLDGRGGGHKNACGGDISQTDFPEFKKRLETYLKN